LTESDEEASAVGPLSKPTRLCGHHRHAVFRSSPTILFVFAVSVAEVVMNDGSDNVVAVAVSLMSRSLETLEGTFHRIPGSTVVARYVKDSHRDDPGRTLLEVLLFLFVVRTLMQSRTRTEQAGKHFIQFNEKVRRQTSYEDVF
jgi:hypothetical protein